MLICDNTKKNAYAAPGSLIQALNIFVVDPSKMTRDALCSVFGGIEPEISFVPERSINQIVPPEGAALLVLVIINVGAHSLFSGWVRRELVLAASRALPVAVLCDSTDRSEVVEGERWLAEDQQALDVAIEALCQKDCAFERSARRVLLMIRHEYRFHGPSSPCALNEPFTNLAQS